MDASIRAQVEIYYREFLRLVTEYGAQLPVMWLIADRYDPSIDMPAEDAFAVSVIFDPQSREYFINVITDDVRQYRIGPNISLNDLYTMYDPNRRTVKYMDIVIHNQGGMRHWIINF